MTDKGIKCKDCGGSGKYGRYNCASYGVLSCIWCELRYGKCPTCSTCNATGRTVLEVGEECSACEGAGNMTVHDEGNYSPCSMCMGKGTIWRPLTEGEIERVKVRGYDLISSDVRRPEISTLFKWIAKGQGTLNGKPVRIAPGRE